MIISNKSYGISLRRRLAVFLITMRLIVHIKLVTMLGKHVPCTRTHATVKRTLDTPCARYLRRGFPTHPCATACVQACVRRPPDCAHLTSRPMPITLPSGMPSSGPLAHGRTWTREASYGLCTAMRSKAPSRTCSRALAVAASRRLWGWGKRKWGGRATGRHSPVCPSGCQGGV